MQELLTELFGESKVYIGCFSAKESLELFFILYMPPVTKIIAQVIKKSDVIQMQFVTNLY